MIETQVNIPNAEAPMNNTMTKVHCSGFNPKTCASSAARPMKPTNKGMHPIAA